MRSLYGRVLLILQIASFALCILPPKITLPSPLVWLLLSISVACAIWILSFNRLGNWTVFPEPLHNARLITRGPYGLVRHPMYGVMMLLGLVGVIHNQSILAVLSWVVLILILKLKASLEETLLMEHFPLYGNYLQRVRYRFFPFIL